MYGDSGNISELFPINEVLILDRRNIRALAFQGDGFSVPAKRVSAVIRCWRIFFIYIET